jgi:hypothetical protein
VDEEDVGVSDPLSSGLDTGRGAGASPKAPGWYASRSNPNDQTYWDGQNWAGRRRWTTDGGWVVVGDAPDEGHESVPPVDRQRLSANPYAPTAPAKRTATGFTINVGTLLLLVSGIALMYGSVGSWVHVHGSVGVADFGVSFNGIDPGISALIGTNGWVTFIGGTLLVVFACIEMTSEESQLAVVAMIIAAVTTVFATYDTVRVVQKISQVPAPASANVSVGWGLICVLSAAVFATLITIVKLLQQ